MINSDMKLMQALIENTLKECLVGINECKEPAKSPYMSDRGAKMMADRLLLNLEGKHVSRTA